MINSEKLKPPLKAITDDATQGGIAGHFSIAPVNATGEVDLSLLEAWAAARGTGQMHKFTQLLLDAVVKSNVNG